MAPQVFFRLDEGHFLSACEVCFTLIYSIYECYRVNISDSLYVDGVDCHLRNLASIVQVAANSSRNIYVQRSAVSSVNIDSCLDNLFHCLLIGEGYGSSLSLLRISEGVAKRVLCCEVKSQLVSRIIFEHSILVNSVDDVDSSVSSVKLQAVLVAFLL